MSEFLHHIVQLVAGLWPSMAGIFAAIVALGILIFVHESGHFIVAKLSGVGVLKFSLGFGRKLIGWKRGETEYMISAVPLGGYVKMLGEEENGPELSPEESRRSFIRQPVWKRAAIVFAGPLFNILLAVFLCYVIFVTGFPKAIAKVADVVPGSPAAAAGFRAGDIIEKIDGEYMDVWQQVAEYVKGHPGKTATFTVRRDSATLDIKAAPVKRDDSVYLGLMGSVIIEAIEVGSPADRAGIKPKDQVLAVDGARVGSWDEMAQVVKANPGRELKFTLLREGRMFDVKATPVLKEISNGGARKVSVIGVMMGTDTEKVVYGPLESVVLSMDKASAMTGFTVAILTRLIRGKEDATQLGSPIAIVQISESQMRRGFADFMLFLAMLSINLGILNLFPIPILDGGHLMFFGIEAVMGRPLSMRKREIAQQVGLFILIGLMVFVFYNDIMRWLGLYPMWK